MLKTFKNAFQPKINCYFETDSSTDIKKQFQVSYELQKTLNIYSLGI